MEFVSISQVINHINFINSVLSFVEIYSTQTGEQLFQIDFPPIRALKFITVQSAYTYKFQLKTTNTPVNLPETAHFISA